MREQGPRNLSGRIPIARLLGRVSLAAELRLARWDMVVVCAAFPHPISGSEGAVALCFGARQSALPGAARLIRIGLLIVISSKQGGRAMLSRSSFVLRRFDLDACLGRCTEIAPGLCLRSTATCARPLMAAPSSEEIPETALRLVVWRETEIGLEGAYLLGGTLQGVDCKLHGAHADTVPSQY